MPFVAEFLGADISPDLLNFQIDKFQVQFEAPVVQGAGSYKNILSQYMNTVIQAKWHGNHAVGAGDWGNSDSDATGRDCIHNTDISHMCTQTIIKY